MTSLEQSIKAAEKRVAKRDARFNKKVVKRARKGKWSEFNEKWWAEGSAWKHEDDQGHMTL